MLRPFEAFERAETVRLMHRRLRRVRSGGLVLASAVLLASFGPTAIAAPGDPARGPTELWKAFPLDPSAGGSFQGTTRGTARLPTPRPSTPVPSTTEAAAEPPSASTDTARILALVAAAVVGLVALSLVGLASVRVRRVAHEPARTFPLAQWASLSEAVRSAPRRDRLGASLGERNRVDRRSRDRRSVLRAQLGRVGTRVRRALSSEDMMALFMGSTAAVFLALLIVHLIG